MHKVVAPQKVWIHKRIQDFEQGSFEGTGRLMLGGTKVQVSKRWKIKPKTGSLAGKTLTILNVKGPNDQGDTIEWWALATDFGDAVENQ